MQKYPILTNETNSDICKVLRDITRQHEADADEFNSIYKSSIRALSELQPANDKIPAFTGAGSAELISITDIGRRQIGTTFLIRDDFTGGTGSYGFSSNTIGSGTINDGTSTLNHPGVMLIVSSATANSGANSRARLTSFQLSGTEVFNCIFQIENLTNLTLRTGFIDTGNSVESTDGVYFDINSAGTCIGKTSNNSVRSSTSTIATLSTATWYHARITLNSDATLATFEIFNDSGASLGSSTLSSNIPTSSTRLTGAGLVATESAGATQNLVSVDYIEVYMTRLIQRGAYQS